MRKNSSYFSKWLLTLIVFIPFLFIPLQQDKSQYIGQSKIKEEAKDNTVVINMKKDSKTKDVSASEANDRSVKLSHDELETITEQFIDLLVQETDDEYKVVHFSTKESLTKEFLSITSRGVAEKYINYYYEKRNDGLYIIPTETPPWFQNDKEYEMIYLDEKKVRITQSNTNELFGSYTLKLELTFTDKWRITKTTHM